MPTLIFLALCSVFLGIPVILLMARRRSAATWAGAAALFTSLALMAPLIPEVLAGKVIVSRWNWLPEWGLNLSLRLDGLGMMFSILVIGIGLLIVLYTVYYLPTQDNLARFFGLLLAFAGAMLGIVLAENILLLLVFWEMTSVASFLLIAYRHEAHDARLAARMGLAVTGGGGLALLAGLLLLGHMAGSFELSDILARRDQIPGHAFYPLTLALILIGVFTKSAQFPFHFWLPNAMAAPTPVSAYLHSATMVKAGVFLLARLYPALSGTDLWFGVVSATGAVTFVYGAYAALFQHDFKGLLAYSTISHLGLITLLFGLDTPLTAVAAVFHIINHAIFKASLFMAAGVIDHECGTRDMRRINGLFWRMPYTATLGIVAAGAMAGVPLLNGFLSKEMFFAQVVEHPYLETYGWAVPAFATLAGALSVAYSLRFIHDVFFNGEPVNLPRTPHEPVLWMRLPIDLLVLLCVVVGLFPQFSVGALLAAAVGAVLHGPPPAFELAVWHGFTAPLLMSAIAITGGVLYYSRREILFRWREQRLPRLHSRAAFERLYQWMTRIAAKAMAFVDNASLQRYTALLIGFSVCLGSWAYMTGPFGAVETRSATPSADAPSVAMLSALTLGSAGVAIWRRRRMLALIFLSVVGLVSSLTFIRFSAPDLAMTQLSVDVVTLVLLLLALHFLPKHAPRETSRLRLTRDLALAGLGGGGAAALSYVMLTLPFETISNFYLQNAVPGGGGSNVVNVILVDFRGFDTLGEITVLAMAALGAQALLGRLSRKPSTGGSAPETDRRPIMLEMLVRPMLPLAITVSVYILLRGHNLPGGGFIAGLITAIALTLQYLASGVDFVRARLRIDYLKLLAAGVLLCMGTGLASWLFGAPFLTSAHIHLHAPLVGETPLASAMVFDFGVYLVVVTSVLLALTELGDPGRRERDSAFQANTKRSGPARN